MARQGRQTARKQATKSGRSPRTAAKARNASKSGKNRQAPPKTSRTKRRSAVPTPKSGIRQNQFTGPPVGRGEAIWLRGRVPTGYWDYAEHRRLYLRWLGHKLGFCKVEDWYRISTKDFIRNHGSSVLAMWWNSSAIMAVKEGFPNHDWKEWLFRVTPLRFWKDPRNHRRYMRWLGQELGIRRPSDWYGVSHQGFARHSGGGFMLYYNCTASLAIMNHLPNYDWKEWLFEPTPKGFWHKKANRRRYMNWLGKRLGYKSLGDWYHVTETDFDANKGIQFLKLYRGSPMTALQDCFPSYEWNEWMFARVPFGFWDKVENRRRYIRWLATKLKITTPKDWRGVRATDIRANCGGGLLLRYHSYLDLLRECVPELRRCKL